MALNSSLVYIADGSGRKLRGVQRDALEWIADKWSTGKHLALSLPVGSGKSLLAKAVQNFSGGAIVTPNNSLVKQYVETYKDLPYYIGKAHYKCKSGDGISCSYKTDVLKMKCCETCDYIIGKKAALSGAPCLYNPSSLLHIRNHDDFVTPRVMIIDEAHAVLSLIRVYNSTNIKYKSKKDLLTRSGVSDPLQLRNELVLIPFLEKEVSRLQEDLENFEHTWTPRTLMSRRKKITNLELVLEGVKENPQLYAVYVDQEKCNIEVKNVKVPKSLIRRVFGQTRFVFFSATLFETDLAEFLQEEGFEYRDLPSPIPVENRPIYYRPLPFPLNNETNPQKIAEFLEVMLKEHPNVNTLIHIPYSLAHRVALFMTTKVFTHRPDNKDEQLEKWKKQGGVFIGSGVNEGIDLKGDLCRLNIVVKIPFPNKGDMLVTKRQALEDGQLWYASESLKSVVQSVGRSTRSEDDFSETYVLDPNFPRLVKNNHDWLPKAFTSSIIWSKR